VLAVAIDAKDLAPDASRLIQSISSSLGQVIEDHEQQSITSKGPAPAIEGPKD
jgi:hypothetical protein